MAPPPLAVLWHPDDLVVEVDPASGLVVAVGGPRPFLVGPDGPPVGRPIEEVLLSPPFARLCEGHDRRRRSSSAPLFDAVWRAPDGTTRHTETVVVAAGDRLRLYARDVTQEREERDLLARRAATDPLTGLPNRAVLDRCLRSAAARSARSGEPWAVAVLDLDGFKQLNDVAGHDAGDRMLVAVATSLQHAARGADDVLRLGGDELVVVVRDLVGPDAAARVGHRLLEAVRRSGDGGTTASVGVAVAQGAHGEPASVLAAADAAMYEVKRAGGDATCVVRVAQPS
jgi:diguanylate cyclase (GGDEF)-like protein